MSDAVTWTIRNLQDGSVREGLSRVEAERELRRAMGGWAPESVRPQKPAASRSSVEREVALAA